MHMITGIKYKKPLASRWQRLAHRAIQKVSSRADGKTRIRRCRRAGEKYPHTALSSFG
jgi:hypothetical protein